MTHNLPSSLWRHRRCFLLFGILFSALKLSTVPCCLFFSWLYVWKKSQIYLKGEGESLDQSRSRNDGRELESEWMKHTGLNVQNRRLLYAWKADGYNVQQGVYCSTDGQMIMCPPCLLPAHDTHMCSSPPGFLTRCYSFKSVSKKPVMHWLTFGWLKWQSALWRSSWEQRRNDTFSFFNLTSLIFVYVYSRATGQEWLSFLLIIGPLQRLFGGMQSTAAGLG